MKVAEQIEILERIARDEQTNATARVTAIRALRTVERDRESDELVDELDRLIADKRRWLRPGSRRPNVRSFKAHGAPPARAIYVTESVGNLQLSVALHVGSRDLWRLRARPARWRAGKSRAGSAPASAGSARRASSPTPGTRSRRRCCRLPDLDARGAGAALGLIEGIAEGLAGAARLVGGALADDPSGAARPRSAATPHRGALGADRRRTRAGRSASCAPGRGPRAASGCRRATRCWPTSSPPPPTGGPTASSGRWTTSARSSARPGARPGRAVGVRTAILLRSSPACSRRRDRLRDPPPAPPEGSRAPASAARSAPCCGAGSAGSWSASRRSRSATWRRRC